jgi:hypothetical protein
MHFSFLQKRTEIYDFYNIEEKYLKLLDDTILLNYPFIKYLNACNNIKITNVNHLNNLIKLNPSGNFCGINDNGIKHLNLRKLNASFSCGIDNDGIKNLNLQILNASGELCKINNKGIQHLNLIKLTVSNNPNITHINHITKLTELVMYVGWMME